MKKLFIFVLVLFGIGLTAQFILTILVLFDEDFITAQIEEEALQIEQLPKHPATSMTQEGWLLFGTMMLISIGLFLIGRARRNHGKNVN